MPGTIFCTPIDFVSQVLAASYSPGSGQVQVAAGTGSLYGTPSASAPIRLELVKATVLDIQGRVTDRTGVSVYKCTGRTGDILTGLTLDTGTDQAFAIADYCVVAETASTISTIQTSVNALEGALTFATPPANRFYRDGGGGTANPLFGPIVAADLPTSTVTPGTYNSANITVDAFGRIVAATSGAGSGTVTSVGLSVPTGLTVTGSPITDAGTFTISTTLTGIIKGTGSGFTPATADTDYLTPTGSGASLTSLNGSSISTGTVPVARLPVLVASGASHAAGLAPDPGVTSGTTKFLREDSTWQVPAGSGSGISSITLVVPTGLGVTGSPLVANGTLTITTALSGIVKGNGTGLVAATAGTDFYAPGTTIASGDIPNLAASKINSVAAGVLKGSGGLLVAATAGTDFVQPSGNITGSAGSLSTTIATNTLWGGQGTGVPTSITAGSGITISGGVISASGGSGTVTSVSLSLPSIITVSGSPVTGSGTLTGTLATQSANTIWAGPTTGAAAAPSFRQAVGADIPATGLVINQHYGAITADTDGATITFDLSAATGSDRHSVTLGGNRTLALSGAPTVSPWASFMLILKQDGTGSRTVTWFAGITWLTVDNNPPTLPTGANKRAVVSFIQESNGVYLGFYNGSQA